MATEKFTSYGLRELHIAPLVEDVAPKATYGELVRAWGAQEATATVTVSEAELRGDDGVVEVDSNVSGLEFSFKNAVLSFEALKAALGGAISDILDSEGGVTVGKRYVISGAQNLPYFAMIAKTEKEGSLLVILPKVKATGGLEITFTDEEYCVISISGKGVRRDADGELLIMEKYEATKAIDAEILA